MSFGVTTDYLGLGDTNWRPQSSALNPTAAGEAQAMDSHGDLRASTVHGKAKFWRVAYKVVGTDSSGTFNPNNKSKLGKIIAVDSVTNAVVTGIEVATVNTEFPIVTVSGPQFFGDSTYQRLYTVPGVTALIAQKRAQDMGCAVADSNRLNTCTLTASLQVVNAADSLGAFVQTDAYQGRAEVTAEAVNAGTAPAITADSGWTTSKDQDVNTSNTEYGRGVFNAFKNILPDT